MARAENKKRRHIIKRVTAERYGDGRRTTGCVVVGNIRWISTRGQRGEEPRHAHARDENFPVAYLQMTGGRAREIWIINFFFFYIFYKTITRPVEIHRVRTYDNHLNITNRRINGVHNSRKFRGCEGGGRGGSGQIHILLPTSSILDMLSVSWGLLKLKTVELCREVVLP